MSLTQAGPVESAVRAIEADLIALRRDLHRHPELSFEEHRTSQMVAQRMKGLGLDVHTGVGGTGVVADLFGRRSGPRILIRADMDALPIDEETELPFSSKVEGVMHACGHDAHVAALVGAAVLLSSMRDQLRGSIRFCFQPAEEILSGADKMIADGVMENVDGVIGGHVLSMMPLGNLAIVRGPFLAGADFFDLIIQGRAGHAGMPHSSIDPIYAAAKVIDTLQSIVARETKPGEPLVVSISSIHAGTSANVTSEDVHLQGNLRWFSESERSRALARIRAIADGVAKSLRAKAKLTITASAPVTVNTDSYVDLIQSVVHETRWATAKATDPLTASDDFARYLQKAPGIYFGVGAGKPRAAPHHHPKFEIDERSIGGLCELLVRCALSSTSAV